MRDADRISRDLRLAEVLFRRRRSAGLEGPRSRSVGFAPLGGALLFRDPAPLRLVDMGANRLSDELGERLPGVERLNLGLAVQLGGQVHVQTRHTTHASYLRGAEYCFGTPVSKDAFVSSRCYCPQ